MMRFMSGMFVDSTHPALKKPGRLARAYHYALAVLLIGILIVARLYLLEIFGPRAGYIVFFPGIVISAIVGGLGPGLLAVAISTGFAWYWLSRPGTPIVNIDIVALALFAFNGIVIAFICERTRRADRLATAAAWARLKAEQVQQLTEGRLRAVFGQSVVGVATTDLNGQILNVNQRLCSLLGYTDDELVGRGLFEITHADDLKRNLELFNRLIHEGTPFTLDKRYVRKDGSPLWVNKSVSLVRSVDGQAEACVIIVIDISESVRAREMLVRQATERERALAGERIAREEAERANRLKDEFLATLSHELRTPLNAILGWAQILSSRAQQPTGEVPEHLVEGITVIERNARAQTQLIEDLLDMSRIISGKLRLEAVPVDLPNVIGAAVDVIRPAASAKQLTLALDIGSPTPPGLNLMGDSGRLQQVVWNLLSNAVKFTSAGGTISVSLRWLDDVAQVAVSDTGQGIGPTFLPHVFDRFSQADGSTTRRHGGLGLGLAIVKQLVELHGGTVDVHSDGVGMGATFFVCLPLHRTGRTPSVAPTLSPIPPTPEEKMNLHGTRVLVIENERDTRELVRQFLESSNAAVTAVETADEGLSHIRLCRPDVVVCDIGMPGRDGYDLIREMRAMDDSSRTLPAIALTAFARPEDKQRVLAAGFDVHLAKPVEPQRLIHAVASLTSRVAV
jgi:PAS domain S-box-containing protein